MKHDERDCVKLDDGTGETVEQTSAQALYIAVSCSPAQRRRLTEADLDQLAIEIWEGEGGRYLPSAAYETF